jgi:hypothetical protein
VAQGLLTAGQTLRFRGDEARACTVEARADGAVLAAGGREFTTPSGASAFLNGGKPSSGFVDLRYQDATGQWRPLENLRDEYRRRFASKVADPDGN